MKPVVETRAFEVRCQRCNTSFAVGTRRCVHCGGRIGARPPPVDPLALGGGGGGASQDEEVELLASPNRALLWIITAVVAMAGSLFRICQGG